MKRTSSTILSTNQVNTIGPLVLWEGGNVTTAAMDNLIQTPCIRFGSSWRSRPSRYAAPPAPVTRSTAAAKAPIVDRVVPFVAPDDARRDAEGGSGPPTLVRMGGRPAPRSGAPSSRTVIFRVAIAGARRRGPNARERVKTPSVPDAARQTRAL